MDRIRNPAGLTKMDWIEKHQDKPYVDGIVRYHVERGRSRMHGLTSAYSRFSGGGSNNSQRPTAIVELIRKYKPRRVVDPCAGFGARLLGCVSQRVPYVGFDTNERLVPKYEDMLAVFPGDAVVHCEDSSRVDYSSLPEYDMVFTSTPYWKLGAKRPVESYDGMPAFASREEFMADFLFPMITKSYAALAPGGVYILCMPPCMFEAVSVLFAFEPESSEVLRTSPPSRAKNPERVYVWRKPRNLLDTL